MSRKFMSPGNMTGPADWKKYLEHTAGQHTDESKAHKWVQERLQPTVGPAPLPAFDYVPNADKYPELYRKWGLQYPETRSECRSRADFLLRILRDADGVKGSVFHRSFSRVWILGPSSSSGSSMPFPELGRLGGRVVSLETVLRWDCVYAFCRAAEQIIWRRCTSWTLLA